MVIWVKDFPVLFLFPSALELAERLRTCGSLNLSLEDMQLKYNVSSVGRLVKKKEGILKYRGIDTFLHVGRMYLKPRRQEEGEEGDLQTTWQAKSCKHLKIPPEKNSQNRLHTLQTSVRLSALVRLEHPLCVVSVCSRDDKRPDGL